MNKKKMGYWHYSNFSDWQTVPIRVYCTICKYETLPIPVKHYRCSGCGKDYG